jgi:glycosyltransferase A (GT-A) superfamily protein (DUF2064 family)
MRIVVLAKAPVAGRSKTRLQARWTPGEAAELAEAALADTLTVVAAVSGVDRDLVLEGTPGDWLPEGFRVRSQVTGSLAARIHAALAPLTEPSLLIGMDTPQVTADLLGSCVAELGSHDAALGLAQDGGWWALGLAAPKRHAHLVLGVPTSTHLTGQLQSMHLRRDGLSVAALPVLRDVDTPEDADAVAALAPGTRFSSLVSALNGVSA